MPDQQTIIDSPEAMDIIERLCKLHARVMDEVVTGAHAGDCCCGRSGFWTNGHGASRFRNEGLAVDWIERTVTAQLDLMAALRASLE